MLQLIKVCKPAVLTSLDLDFKSLIRAGLGAAAMAYLQVCTALYRTVLHRTAPCCTRVQVCVRACKQSAQGLPACSKAHVRQRRVTWLHRQPVPRGAPCAVLCCAVAWRGAAQRFEEEHAGDVAVDDLGNTYLHVAAEMGAAPEVIRAFVAKGLNANTPNKENDSPLHVACRAGSVEVSA